MDLKSLVVKMYFWIERVSVYLKKTLVSALLHFGWEVVCGDQRPGDVGGEDEVCEVFEFVFMRCEVGFLVVETEVLEAEEETWVSDEGTCSRWIP